MRSPTDLSRLIKFLTRDHWKVLFEEVLGQHFGPAMREFDLEYEAIGAALGGGWGGFTAAFFFRSWQRLAAGRSA